MRSTSCLALVALLLAATSSFAETDAERAADVAGLVKALQSADARTRSAAAEKIAELGYLTIERVGRRSASLDAVAWQAFADACVRKKWYPDACALVAAAHAAPEAHRARLIELAAKLDSEAGMKLTPEEIAARVHRTLVEERGVCSDSFYAAPVAICGHAAVPAVLALLREKDERTVDYERASDVLELIAEPEDLPALRELLLAGKTSAAAALERLDGLGFAEALPILVDAVDAGGFDLRIASALWGASDRPRAAQAVRKWAATPGRIVSDEDRQRVAMVFARLDSREDVPTLEAWIDSSRDSSTLLELGESLTRLGSRRGIELLVRIAEEKEGASTTGAPDAARLRAEGFKDWQRRTALDGLDRVAAQVSGKVWDPVHPVPGPWAGHRYNELDRIAAEVRAWWEASRDRLSFDTGSGRWRLAPK